MSRSTASGADSRMYTLDRGPLGAVLDVLKFTDIVGLLHSPAMVILMVLLEAPAMFSALHRYNPPFSMSGVTSPNTVRSVKLVLVAAKISITTVQYKQLWYS